MLKRFLRALSGSKVGRMVRAAYDAALTTDENRKHWQLADQLDAVEAMNPVVRGKLRSRARYEIANNPLAAGIADTLACDIIGVGPSLQIDIDDDTVAEFIEDEFHDWAEEINLWELSRVAERALLDTGDVFWKFVHNPRLQSRVKLGLELIEADRVMTPIEFERDPDVVDGIRFDEFGNKAGYYIAKRHPGSRNAGFGWFKTEFEYVEARHIVHDLELIRPGQVRGIPGFTPSLQQCAILRRWELAVVAAAEKAATLGAVLIETELSANTDDDVEVGEPGSGIQMQRNQATFLPAGSKAHQMKAEQPTSTHEAFLRAGVRSMARPSSMPVNIALGDSSGMNYASGRLDHQTYDRRIAIRQDRRGSRVVTPIMLRWFSEAVLIEDYLPQAARTLTMRRPKHLWLWQERPHVDPAKNATADDTALANRTTSYRKIFGRRGEDYRREFRQIEREQRDLENRKIVPAKSGAAALAPVTPNGSDVEDERDERESEGEDAT